MRRPGVNSEVNEIARRAYAAARGTEPTTDTLERMAGEIAAVLAVRSAAMTEGPTTDGSDSIPTLDELETETDAAIGSLDWEEAADGVSWRTVEEGLVGFAQSDETSLFLDDLRALALAASPGPWLVDGDRLVRAETEDGPAETEVARVTSVSPEQRERDAAFLSAFDPSMVLTLLFQNRQLELENGRLRRTIDNLAGTEAPPSTPL